jgi:hypothetical protein
MGISKTCLLVSEFEEGALAEIDQKLLVFDGTRFPFRKGSKKVVCREIGGVELTMMKASSSNNNESIREIIVKLVYMECISHWNEGC